MGVVMTAIPFLPLLQRWPGTRPFLRPARGGRRLRVRHHGPRLPATGRRPRRGRRALPALRRRARPRPLLRPGRTPRPGPGHGGPRVRLRGQGRRHRRPVRQPLHLGAHPPRPRGRALAGLPRPGGCLRRARLACPIKAARASDTTFPFDPLRVRCVAARHGMLYLISAASASASESAMTTDVFAQRMAASARGAADRGLARHHGVARRDVPGDDSDVEGLRRGPCPARRERASRRDRGGEAAHGARERSTIPRSSGIRSSTACAT